jgi:hypothetical protein
MKKTTFALALFAVVEAAAAPDSCNQDLWVPNSSVTGIFVGPKTVYIGGNFSEVGPYTGGCAAFSLATGAPAAKFPKVNGDVNAICADGVGGWFIGGNFTTVDGAARNNIAHILSDGNVDPAWDANADNLVRCLSMNGSTLIAGGDFTSIGGQSRARLAGLNFQTGKAADWETDANKTVLCIASDGSNIYVGGNFTELISSQEAKFCMGLTTGWAPHHLWDAEAPNNPVHAIAVNGPTVYAGGEFTNISHDYRARLAALRAVNGDTVTSFEQPVNGTVKAIAVGGTSLYVGGDFTECGGLSAVSRNHIAQLTADSGKLLSWNPDVDNTVRTRAVSGSTVYAGGDFSAVGGVSRRCLVAIDAGSGSALAWDPRPNDEVLALATSATTLYAGGKFTSLGGVGRGGIAAFDPATGLPLAFNPEVNGRVNAFAQVDSILYIGGSFSSVGGQSRANFAALHALTGAVLDRKLDANGEIHCLTVNGPIMYAAGAFTSIGGLNRNHLAAINTASGSLTIWNPNADSAVRAVEVLGARVYAGGHFKNIGQAARNCLAALDSGTGEALPWNPNANGSVDALALRGFVVYAAGRFIRMSGAVRNHIAALDATSGSLLSWNPDANKDVHTLAVAGSTVYAGGYFDSVAGQARKYAAAIDGDAGTLLPWDTRASGSVSKIAANGTTVFAGGSFRSMGRGVGHSYFAQFGAFRPAPLIVSIAPPSGVDSAGVAITDLHGSDFRPGAAVKMVKAGQPDISATNVAVVSAAQITCNFPIINAAPGAWSIVVVNDDAKADTLFQGFTVIPRPPALIAPGNDAPGVSLTPRLMWRRSASDSLYTLQVSSSRDFQQFVINDNLIADTSVAVPQALLANSTAYYWKVASTKKGGAVTPFCQAWTFTTAGLPGQVSLVSPAAAAIIAADSVVFAWNRLSGADRFCLEVFVDSLLNGRLSIDSSIVDTAVVARKLQNKTSYWWRVSAHSGAGWGSAGEIRKLTVGIPVTAVLPAAYSCVVRGLSKSGSMITYGLPSPGGVLLRLYDVTGRMLKTMAFTGRTAGYHRVSIPLREFPSGYVILEFNAGAFTTTRILPNF